jgi:threonine dehydratase
MPETAPLAKIQATQSYGGEIVLHGQVYDDAFRHARELERANDYVFVHPFDDPDIIAGQGTLGLELLEQIPDLDSLVVPIGGGGLASGIATAVKAMKPSVRIYGVVSDVSPGMLQLYRGHEPDPPLPTLTIADGISVKTASPRMHDDYIKPLVDDIVAVNDEEIAESIVYFLERAKTLVEGSGAVVLAAATKAKWDLGRSCALILSGGNIDLNLVSKTIERGLSVRGRLHRFTMITNDRPGQLMRLCEVIARGGANIVDVAHDRVHPGVRVSETVVELLVETRGPDHVRKLKVELEATGARSLGGVE